MAEEKKPKIDLKTRLQKMSGGAPPAAGSNPAVIPVPGKSVPAPQLTPVPPPAIPVPPGVSSPFQTSPPAGAIDPNNPLAAMTRPFQASAAPSAPAVAPQKIEVDEGTVQQARSGVRKQMFIIAPIVLIVGGAIGYALGGVTKEGDYRTKSVADAAALSKDVNSAKESMKKLAEKLTDARKQLDARKYPDALAKELADINIDFDGQKLQGRRFSGVAADTTRDLFELITDVKAVNDRKRNLQGLLARLQKPLSEEFALPKDAPPPLKFSVLIDKDQAPYSLLVPLEKPWAPTKDKPNLPDKLSLAKSKTENVEVPRWTNLDKAPDKWPVNLPVTPSSFERACPSEGKKDFDTLRKEMLALKNDLILEASEDSVESKMNLVQKADRVIDGLAKVR